MRDLTSDPVRIVDSDRFAVRTGRESLTDASDVYAWTYEHVLFPAWQKLVHGRGTDDHLRELELSQWMTPAMIARKQVESLRALLCHAMDNVPYYRELFAKIGFDPRDVTSRDDLQALPVLTREIIHERHDDLLDPSYRGATIRKGTSGTSGKPLRFEYCNSSEAWRQALRLRGYGWAGFHQGLPTLHYWAQPPAIPRGLGAAKIMVDRALRREVYVDAIQQDEASLRQAVEVIRHLRPRVIVGYTMATALFARFVNDQGLRTWDLDIPVICGAEGLLPADRAAIERAFGPAFETYGSRETMLVGAECGAHDGLHISEENLIVEIAGDGRAAAEGETGEVVVTDLHNYAMPFIRYVNGDLASISPGRCQCGRGLRRLAKVEGRSCDTLRDPNGAPIPGMLFIALFARKDDLVKQFQVVQHAAGDVLLKVVPGSEWSDSAFSQVEGRFREQLRGLRLEVERHESIPPSASGKRRPIVVEPPASIS
jgi:phenylacetate-CoA ligase